MERMYTQLSKEKEETMSPRYSSCPPERRIWEAFAVFLTQLSLMVQSKRPHGKEQHNFKMAARKCRSQSSRHFPRCFLKKVKTWRFMAIYGPIWLQLLKCPMAMWLRLRQSQWIQLCLLPFNKPQNKSPAWSSWLLQSQTRHLSLTHISWLASCPPTRTAIWKNI